MKCSPRTVLYALIFIAALVSVGFLLVGPPALLLSLAFVGGLVFWLLTTYHTNVDPRAIMTPYLLTVIVFIIHVYEEYAANIELSLSAISGTDVSQAVFLTVAAFAAPIVWLSGAVMMLLRWPIGFFFASTFLFGMMFGEPSHLLFPFLEDGTFHYSAGMLTAALPVIGGWYTFFVLRREMAKAAGHAD